MKIQTILMFIAVLSLVLLASFCLSHLHKTDQPKPSATTNNPPFDLSEEIRADGFDEGAFWAYSAGGRHYTTNFGELRMWAHIDRDNALMMLRNDQEAIARNKGGIQVTGVYTETNIAVRLK